MNLAANIRIVGQLTLIVVLVLGTAVLLPLADWLRLPYPVLVTVLGLGIALIPGVPALHIEPDLILPLVLPPLLFATARRTSWGQFAANAKAILLLAVALVFVTTAAVAAVARWAVPGLTVAGAVALGALVSPPDPVAATAVAGPLKLPRRLVSVLEGEGLFNDVTALVLYQVALAAVVTGSFSPGRAAADFLLAAGVALLIGFAAGWLVHRLNHLLGDPDPTPQILVSLLIPAVVYVAADHTRGSGVLAVLVYTLYMVNHPAPADDVAARVTTDAFWEITETLITGVAFGLIGLELRTVADTVAGGWTALLGPAAAVVATVVLIRVLWLLPAVWTGRRPERAQRGIRRQLDQPHVLDPFKQVELESLGRRVQRRIDARTDTPLGWREAVIMWWAGMRGVATVALALALPLTTDSGEDFPGRPQLVFVAFCVVLCTLIAQGVTLPTVARWLKVADAARTENAAERALAERAATAATNALRRTVNPDDLPAPLARRIGDVQLIILTTLSPGSADDLQGESRTRADWIDQWRDYREQAATAARSELMAARKEPGADLELVDHLIHRLDMHSMSPAT